MWDQCTEQLNMMVGPPAEDTGGRLAALWASLLPLTGIYFSWSERQGNNTSSGEQMSAVSLTKRLFVFLQAATHLPASIQRNSLQLAKNGFMSQLSLSVSRFLQAFHLFGLQRFQAPTSKTKADDLHVFLRITSQMLRCNCQKLDWPTFTTHFVVFLRGWWEKHPSNWWNIHLTWKVWDFQLLF